jgi:hypothetical protein
MMDAKGLKLGVCERQNSSKSRNVMLISKEVVR